jgi:serine/threonine protein kinase
MNRSNLVPKVVGEGGFGCVHRPPLKCKDTSKGPVNKNMVSKLLSKGNARQELYEAEMMSSIDKEQYFHISPISSCEPSNIPTNIEAIDKCKHFKASSIDDYEILMQEDGGIDLVKFENKYAYSITTNDSRIAMEKFWVSMSRIMYGLTELNRHNQVHHDLKSQNIVYNEDTGQAKMIDFGLLMEDKEVETDELRWSYPPEVELYNFNEYDNVIQLGREEKLVYARDTALNLLNRHKPLVEYIYYQHVDGNTKVFGSKLAQQFLSSILDMDADRKNHSVELYPGLVLYGFDAFRYISVTTFDSYGVGLCCVSMINHTRDHLHNPELADELKSLFMNMVNWNVFNRFTPKQIITTYESIMQKYELLEKYNFRFENHKLVEGYIAPLEIKGIKEPDPNELKTIEESPPISPMPTRVEIPINDKSVTPVLVPPMPPSISTKTKTNQTTQSGGSKRRKSKNRRMTRKRKKQIKKLKKSNHHR